MRSPDALRPLTLRNFDCRILTTAICRGLHWYTMRCIHPSQRCISSRQMTDNVFEIEPTALAHVAFDPREYGILLTDFAAAYPSVNHSWIFHVLAETELPEFICRFPGVLSTRIGYPVDGFCRRISQRQPVEPSLLSAMWFSLHSFLVSCTSTDGVCVCVCLKPFCNKTRWLSGLHGSGAYPLIAPVTKQWRVSRKLFSSKRCRMYKGGSRRSSKQPASSR